MSVKTGPLQGAGVGVGGLGLFPAKSLRELVGVSGLSCNYSIDCLYEI